MIVPDLLEQQLAPDLLRQTRMKQCQHNLLIAGEQTFYNMYSFLTCVVCAQLFNCYLHSSSITNICTVL